jgi:putative phosphoribosyl transferase
MFRDREDAALRLAEMLHRREMHAPIVLGVPRGGVVIGAIAARELGADLGVVLARKLRHRDYPELAIGAISETGEVYLDRHGQEVAGQDRAYLEQECRLQLAEIERRKTVLRGGRPLPPLAGRTVIVTDDGIATGSTMIAALKALKAQGPREVIVAVPVAAPQELGEVRRWCDDLVCPLSPPWFRAVGQFYEDFTQVEDEEVVVLLHAADSPHGVASEP